MSVLDDMLRKHASGKSHLHVIEVIWTVTDPGKSEPSIFSSGSARTDGRRTLDSLYSLLPELTPLMQPRASPYNALSLRFNVHWTRVSSRPSRVPRAALPPGMYLRRGRPDLFATLETVIVGVRTAYSTSRSNSGGPDLPSGIVIGSCGPAALMDDSARAVGRVSWADWRDVGGVESIEECVYPILVISGRMLKESWTGYLGGNDFLFIFSSWTLLVNFNSDDIMIT
jgi:ferric-chelate reductase